MADYSKLTVVKLKDELKARGLAITGLKAALVARLDEDDATAEEVPTEAVTAEDASADANDTVDAAEDPKDGEEPVDLVAKTQEAIAPAQESQKPDIVGAQVEKEQTDEVLPSESTDNLPTEETLPTAGHTDSEQTSAVEPTSGELPPASKEANEEEATETTHEQDTEMQEAATESTPVQDTEMQEVKPAEAEAPAVQQQHEPLPVADATGGEENMQTDKDTIPETQIQSTQNDEPAPTQSLGEPIDERASQMRAGNTSVEVHQLGTQGSVGVEDIAEDRRKRKRRSHSPVPSTQEAAHKKLRAEDGSPRSRVPGDTPVQPQTDAQMTEAPESLTEPTATKPSGADARFKGLFTATSAPTQRDDTQDTSYQDRDIEPAIHPATTALYIRNLQRPLQPDTVKEHLGVLSQPGNQDSSVEEVVEFFLDTIRSHCIVQLSSVSAASRVRLALHETVWPKERDRKPLWVDYIPEEKIKEWIETEKSSAGSRPPKRWEVVYDKDGDEVTAQLRETDLMGLRRPTVQVSRDVPPTPQSEKRPTPKGDPGRGFKALDDLFKSTTAKPKLYFQPVSTSIVDMRLDLLAKGTGGGRSDEMRRFTFEDDLIVDKGPEWGRAQGERGGRGGFRGGGFAGRGSFRGDSWRRGR